MIYGLEVFSLSTDDIMQLEQLQRKVIRQIQSFPINTALTAVYGLLGIRPIEQELDIRKLVLLGNVFLNKDSLEYEIAHRALTRILKTGVQDSHLAKSRSPTGKSGSPNPKKLESHQFVHTVYLFHFSRK